MLKAIQKMASIIFSHQNILLKAGSKSLLKNGSWKGKTATTNPTWKKKLTNTDLYVRALFKWLWKVITWLQLLRLVIGLKDTRQFFNQWEAKPKPIAPCARDFSRSLSELQVIARNGDRFIALFAPVVIGRKNCFDFGFSTVVWKPLDK